MPKLAGAALIGALMLTTLAGCATDWRGDCRGPDREHCRGDCRGPDREHCRGDRHHDHDHDHGGDRDHHDGDRPM